jgi:hypothetical protein
MPVFECVRGNRQERVTWEGREDVLALSDDV